MLDLRRIREKPEAVLAALRTKSPELDLDEILALDGRRLALLQESEKLKAVRNAESRAIAEVQRAGGDAASRIAAMREVGERIKAVDAELKEVDERQGWLLMRLPNTPHPETPVGRDERDNVVVAEWGEKPPFAFTPRNHLELGEALDILDFPRGAKIAGSGFPVYKGLGARLERALINFMLDLQTGEHGYTEVFPPFLANRESMTATGQLPKMEEDMYHCGKDELFAIPSAEVPITNLHRDEVLPGESLPLRYAGYSACFRREAGSYGKEVRGFLRVHQFNKVELVQFVRPEESDAALNALRGHAEEVLRRLGLHYRVLALCTGDLSFASARTYDLEVWSPAEGRYLECSSCSSFADFQARRGNMRYKDKGGKPQFLHTLNGSGLATSRLIVALLETWQTEDGGVTVPPALRPWMGGRERIG
ncbi:MAG: serine--tRNA ligase [bacterium]|nr:serine--tRNA ligase [bacterium]